MTTVSLSTRDRARQEYVARGRAFVEARLPTEAFDASSWDLRALAPTSATRAQRVYFTVHGSETEALPPAFGEVVKAWVVLTGGAPTRMNQRAFAARWLWKGIVQRLGAEAAELFVWEDLRHADLQAAEQLMINAGLAQGTINKTATTMGDLVRAAFLIGVGSAIQYTPMTGRKRDTSNHRVDDPEARGEGVLSDAAQMALADVFHRATEPRDVFFSSLLALLLASGIRWGEGVTVPLEPLEEEPIRVRDVTGAWVTRRITYLRRHKSKSQRAGGAGRASEERVPLTSQQASLASLAVARLTAVCAEARMVAARLDSTAPVWRWPSAVSPEEVGNREVRELLGCDRTMATIILNEVLALVPGAQREDERRSQYLRVTLDAFEEYMTRRQNWAALWAVKPTAGRTGQRASESLLCLRVNELRAGKPTLPLIDLPSHASLEAWLEGKDDRNVSVFERFEREHGVRYREADGSLVNIDSHMCRRLFVTTALTSGATTVDIARWQGREHIGDLNAYDQRSMAEKVEAVKDSIRAGRLGGQVAQVYVRLAEDVRDEWLEGQVQAMHVTPYGLCVHDFSATPCPLALNCVKGCKDHLFDPSNEQERQVLVQLQRRTKEVIANMAPDAAAGRIAPSWLDEQEQTLRGVERILGLTPPPGGGYVPTHPDGDSRFRPMTGGR